MSKKVSDNAPEKPWLTRPKKILFVLWGILASVYGLLILWIVVFGGFFAGQSASQSLRFMVDENPCPDSLGIGTFAGGYHFQLRNGGSIFSLRAPDGSYPIVIATKGKTPQGKSCAHIEVIAIDPPLAEGVSGNQWETAFYACYRDPVSNPCSASAKRVMALDLFYSKPTIPVSSTST